MDFQEEEFNEILRIFQIESEEIISRLNNNILELEKTPDNKDIIVILFRDAHSLKGAARMVGFNHIQTLAHKIEDILGLAKDNQIRLSPETVNALYKSVDFLSEIIGKSIEQKTEFYDENLAVQISLLDKISAQPQENTEKSKEEFSIKELKNNINEINSLIPEGLFELMSALSGQNQEIIKEFSQKIDRLFEIFKQVGIYDIKKSLEDIKVKLDFVIKTSGSFNLKEIDDFQKIIDGVISNLVSVCEIHAIKTPDYYSLAFEMFSAKSDRSSAQKEPDMPEKTLEHQEEIFDLPPEAIVQKQEVKEFDNKNLLNIKEMFSSLGQNYTSLGELKQKLLDFETTAKDEIISPIINNTLKIIDFSIKNKMKLNEDAISAMEQGIDYCLSRLNNQEEATDSALVIQRLEIIQQVLELSNQSTENENILPRKSTDLIKKNSDLNAIFDTGEIKTLRVDSIKLDSMVSQVGELMIAKIKAKKHIYGLDSINISMDEWHKDCAKVLNHLKYFEKKYPKLQNEDSQSFYFINQILNVLENNCRKFSDTLKEISNLRRMIQEDETKISLIIDELESTVKNIRVLPFATIFHIFGRMVRDIAQEKGKQINFEISGSETSTDKKILEEIKAPLIHIIRNSIDHGIETPQQRISAGKDPVGKIILKASQTDNKVKIEIHDDGKGIDVAKIKEKALKKGYLKKEEADSMSDEQITNLIFAPGFSTGDEITSISGRGIGLDVVQTKISQLNGKVKVLSELNKGCSVIIELPTTMSTLKSFLVRASGQIFAIPMSVINSVMLKNSNEIFFNEGLKTIIIEGKTVPIYNLSAILNLPLHEQNSNKKTILTLESDNKIIGLEVDKLLGDQEILQKKLCAPLYKLKNISGVTTLASGDLCFILNISKILKNINKINYIEQSQPYEKISVKENKILLVDDSITTRTLEKNILTKAGYSVELALNPIEALEKLSKEKFNLIISDIEMPEMNGFEFLRKIKSDKNYSDIPVLMLSSLYNEQERKKAKDYGAKEYLNKNEFNQEEFLGIINNIFQ
ncbi:MAG TPA: hybrid sensor histidine kinase/response regulator [Candidatus Gastranaerophilaceae bacterium]|nr:hybrid sensor histidine kinase/response regulator [Candidatus Gastranaerophilaceae bacterium]HPT41448.1 hybrid sensor histidine kinase/response regulator [Candidatus Gastranaerophilaceae bacterium]